MTAITPPPDLVIELGTAYKDYQIEIRELIALAYAAGYQASSGSQYRTLCSSLLRSIDSGNAEAEELALCQIRTALKLESQ